MLLENVRDSDPWWWLRKSRENQWRRTSHPEPWINCDTLCSFFSPMFHNTFIPENRINRILLTWRAARSMIRRKITKINMWRNSNTLFFSEYRQKHYIHLLIILCSLFDYIERTKVHACKDIVASTIRDDRHESVRSLENVIVFIRRVANKNDRNGAR